MRKYPLLPFALALGTLGATVAQGGEMHDMMEFPRPIDALDNVWIEELTMLEVRDALRDGTTTALILTGGIEENGPYLTTGKHNHVLRVMGESIARRLGSTPRRPHRHHRARQPRERPPPPAGSATHRRPTRRCCATWRSASRHRGSPASSCWVTAAGTSAGWPP